MYVTRIPKVTICCVLFIHIQATVHTVFLKPILGPESNRLGKYGSYHTATGSHTQDQTSSRTNTLFDDADDIQRQLDNEARDRIKFGRPKTIWVFHFPTHFPEHHPILNPSVQDSLVQPQARCPRDYAIQNTKWAEDYSDDIVVTPPLPPSKDWDYNNQMTWSKAYPECGGKSQSPVDLPISGLIKARGARNLLFQNYDVEPKSMTITNDGNRVILSGEWKSEQRPLIYGGAAHSRRYLFHSLTFHLPSEHTVGGLQYPLESQALYVSAEYKNVEEAAEASPSDPQAFLAVANLYKYANHTHKGVHDLLTSAKDIGVRNATFAAHPLTYFNPPFKEYACYQGSMTVPPCTESVLWLIRGRTLSIKREAVEAAQTLLASQSEPRHLYFRSPQSLNDRKVYLFN